MKQKTLEAHFKFRYSTRLAHTLGKEKSKYTLDNTLEFKYF